MIRQRISFRVRDRHKQFYYDRSHIDLVCSSSSQTYPLRTPSTRLSIKKDPTTIRGIKKTQLKALPMASLVWKKTNSIRVTTGSTQITVYLTQTFFLDLTITIHYSAPFFRKMWVVVPHFARYPVFLLCSQPSVIMLTDYHHPLDALERRRKESSSSFNLITASYSQWSKTSNVVSLQFLLKSIQPNLHSIAPNPAGASTHLFLEVCSPV